MKRRKGLLSKKPRSPKKPKRSKKPKRKAVPEFDAKKNLTELKKSYDKACEIVRNPTPLRYVRTRIADQCPRCSRPNELDLTIHPVDEAHICCVFCLFQYKISRQEAFIILKDLIDKEVEEFDADKKTKSKVTKKKRTPKRKTVARSVR